MKATFEGALNMLIMVIFAFIALIAIWLFLEKVMNFSLGLVIGASMKNVFCGVTGGSTVKGVGVGAGLGAAGGLAICGAGIAAAIFTGGIASPMAVGACSLGITIGSAAVGAVAGGAANAKVC